MRKNIRENEDALVCDVCGEEDEGCTCDSEAVVEATSGFTFDKFMDSIVIKETRNYSNVGDSPLRERARRHQERPLGRIRFGGVK